MDTIKHFQSKIQNVLESSGYKINNNKEILKKMLTKILLILDLKLDDNLALIELVYTIKKLDIEINIDIIVTSVKNFDKMIDNLVDHATDIKELFEDNKIRFYRGEQTYEKTHETFIEKTDYELFNMKEWKVLLENLDKYTICFGFAPIYPFITLFEKCLVTILGHGYNTTCYDSNGKPDNIETLKYLKTIKSEIMLYINNYATFKSFDQNNKPIQRGQIEISNRKLLYTLNKIKNGNELIIQAMKDRVLFTSEEFWEIIYEKINDNEVLNIINQYYEDIDKDTKKVEIIEKICSDVNEIILNGDKIKQKKLINLSNNIKKYDPNVIKKHTYFERACDIIKCSKNDQKVEVSDWSQMILLLKIFTDTNFEGFINGLRLNNNEYGVIFEENDREDKMFYIANVDWYKLFL